MVDQYIVVDTVMGQVEAEIVRGFLNAKGIKCELSQEAIGKIFSTGLGLTGSVDILVPSQQGKQARLAIKEYHHTKKHSKKD